jgi:hypothetical protein
MEYLFQRKVVKLGLRGLEQRVVSAAGRGLLQPAVALRETACLSARSFSEGGLSTAEGPGILRACRANAVRSQQAAFRRRQQASAVHGSEASSAWFELPLWPCLGGHVVAESSRKCSGKSKRRKGSR